MEVESTWKWNRHPFAVTNQRIPRAIFCLAFPASNNETEYKALIAGLRLAKAIGARKIDAFCDSQLVAMQFSEDYEAKNKRMDAYLKSVQRLAEKFASFTLTKIPRDNNTSADALTAIAALASSSNPAQRHVIPVENIEKPSIDEASNMCPINEQIEINDDNDDKINEEPQENDEPHVVWRTGEVPRDKWAARRLKARCAKLHAPRRESLPKKNLTGAWLSCIDGAEFDNVMRETHEGARGNHSRGRCLARKIKKLGFYEPTTKADCRNHVARCDGQLRHHIRS